MHACEAMLAYSACLVESFQASFLIDGNADLPTLPSTAHSYYRISVILAT